MEIKWTKCKTYSDSIDFSGVVYVHVWKNKPFYWGICKKSVFGGNRRKLKGVPKNPRYGTSYRHWIEGCLRHGGSLYIGKPLSAKSYEPLEKIENKLMALYPPEINKKNNSPEITLDITHTGDLPPFVKSRERK